MAQLDPLSPGPADLSPSPSDARFDPGVVDAPERDEVDFPADLLLGAATSSHQIEGAIATRGPSIWDSFARLPDRIERGETADIACDHVARFREDVQLMRDMNLQCYRLSLSWPRLLPTGRGEVNGEGVVFYRSLLKACKDAGIATYVTLYHWDLPQALEDAGGWRNRETVAAFEAYVDLAAGRLGDLVDAWIPINEPECIAFLGHDAGVHAPGLRDTRAAFRVAHHLNLAHGLAVQRLRAHGARRIGTALNLAVNLPAAPDHAHQEAARLADLVHNEIWLGPLMDGRYSEELVELARPIGDWDWVRPGDTEIAATPVDFTGVNYYFPRLVAPRRPIAASLFGRWQDIAADEVAPPADAPRTEMGWWVEPKGLSRLIHATHWRTGLPIVVTENGTATGDEPGTVLAPERQLDDVDRVRYLHDHLVQVAAVRRAGVPVQGYFAWSLLDNYEWSCGYRPRFGLVHVDFGTGKRTPKRSASWYTEVARTRRLPAAPPAYRGFRSAPSVPRGCWPGGPSPTPPPESAPSGRVDL